VKQFAMANHQFQPQCWKATKKRKTNSLQTWICLNRTLRKLQFRIGGGWWGGAM
jgi:hypothetical protein